MPHEHDDDLAPTVDARNEIETHDYPKTREDFEAQEPEKHGDEPGDRDEEDIVGK